MYESPINVYEQISNIISDINNQKDNLVYEAVAKVGVDVDKNELIKALQYDRDQYSKGYYDGKAEGVREFAEWIANGFSVNEEWYPGRFAERKVFLVNSYTDSNGYCRCNEKNILSSDEIIAEYEKEQEE